jgi:hypothetical protein
MNDKALCCTCLQRENRPEIGIGGELIYCRKKQMVVSLKTKCDVYTRATKQSVRELERSLYGVIEEGEGEY